MKDPEKLPWKDLNIDVVLECSGKFSDKASASKASDMRAQKKFCYLPQEP